MSPILPRNDRPVKSPDRATTGIPPGEPFHDWTDDDFRAYERYLDAHYGSSAADEQAADRWAIAQEQEGVQCSTT